VHPGGSEVQRCLDVIKSASSDCEHLICAIVARAFGDLEIMERCGEDVMPQRLANFISLPADVPDQPLQLKENVNVPDSVFYSLSLISSASRAGNGR
jgi:hypothetical protein